MKHIKKILGIFVLFSWTDLCPPYLLPPKVVFRPLTCGTVFLFSSSSYPLPTFYTGTGTVHLP
jgi:hypothetical protein